MPPNVTKKDIVSEIFNKMPAITQNRIQNIIQMTMDIVMRSLSEGRSVELRRFGVFEVKLRQEKIGRNLVNSAKKDEMILIPKRASVKFKAGKELKFLMKNVDINRIESNISKRRKRQPVAL